MSISSSDTKVSMLFSLFLANIRVLSCFFFLFLDTLNNLFIIPVAKDKIKVKLALAILAGALITVVKEIIDTPPHVAERTIKILSM